MALVRCSCVHRVARAVERDAGALLVAELRDPFCSAAHVHAAVPAQRRPGGDPPIRPGRP